MGQDQTFTNVTPIAQTFSDVQPVTPPTNVQPKKYAPGMDFGMQVAKGMGFDADRIKAAQDAGTQEDAWKEMGRQVYEGITKFAGSVVKDPFNIAQPIHGMASSLETSVREKSPGQFLGALANILGGTEGASRAGEVAGKARGSIGEAIHTPEGELTPGAKTTGKIVGGMAGAGVGAAVGHEYLGAAAGYKLGPSLLDTIFPESQANAASRAQAEFYMQKAEGLMRRGKEQEALDRKTVAAQKLEEKQRVTPQGRALTPGGKIVDPDSVPPDVKVTYQSIAGKDLLDMVRKGDRLAITEWQRRGLPLPGNVGFMVEDAGSKSWRNLKR